MTLYDQGVESLTPGKLINPKALTTVVGISSPEAN